MKSELERLLCEALRSLVPAVLPEPADESLVVVERARDAAHGDFASNIAMRLAKPARKNPRELAQAIIAALPASPLVAKAELAGAGFINFRLAKDAWFAELRAVAAQGENYGRSKVGAGRKVRFTGVLVGEWIDSSTKRADHYRVWRGRTGKYVLHVERQPEFWVVDAEGKPAGWRGTLGIGDVRYGGSPKESTLEVFEAVDDLRDKVPPELFDMVSRAARQPTLEELDI